MKNINSRTTEYPIDDIFLKRYSPRAMSGEGFSREEFMTIFEAGRWAPSSNNSQPWRFLYATIGTPNFEKFLSFVVDKNQIWCKKAGVLVIVLSKNNLENGTLSIPHSFDTGAAWENIALQSTQIGFIAHAMGGFYRDVVKKELSIPDDYTVEIMIAIGKPGKIEDLPEALHEREKPNDRKKLEEIVFEGNLPK